jgi:hypothetical protein
VGADPEFCSKEHRNQFRLRRGMDRLVEVNKVANLMRRRESAKQIPFANLMCQSAISPRGYFDSERTAIHTTPFQRYVSFGAFHQPHMAAHADECIVPSSRRYSGQKVIRRPNTGRIRIHNLDSRPKMPAARWGMRAKIAQAPASNLHHRAPARPAQREFKLIRQTGIRVHVGDGPAALRRAPFSGSEALHQGVRTPELRSIAAAGNKLRVSIGKGFNIPRAKVRQFQTKPAMRSTLVIKQHAKEIVPDILNQAVHVRSLSSSTTSIELRVPTAPPAVHNSQFRTLGAIPPAMGSALPGTLPGARFTAVAWKAGTAQWNPGGIYPAAAGFARRNGAHLKRLGMVPTSVTSLPQTTLSPFIPQEPKGCPVVPFQAVIAGGAQTSAAPVPKMLNDLGDAPDIKVVSKPAAIAVHFEEQFAGGWDNWVGGVEDWHVDVAGVRTGAMALFMPTLDLIDYELEFLGRIDAKTINWVVRAAGLDQHIRCTLTLQTGNQLEFSRTIIKGGVPEETIVSPTRVQGKKRSAVTVHTSVSGDSFAVDVDGTTVDSWTEERLPSGGVGFVGAADDRARLYWVKVSSQSSGKE